MREDNSRRWGLHPGGLLAAFLAVVYFLPASVNAGEKNQNSKPRTASTSVPSSAALDLSGNAVNPFEKSKKVTVLIFVNPECPISNRYAPEIQRLAKAFESSGVTFWLVYPDADLPSEAIQKHLKEYGYSLQALRDPQHLLVKLARAQVTPEAAVFTVDGRLTYHGRIDNRYVDFGKERIAPTEHDLENALKASLANKPVPRATTKAIGCYIPE